MFTDRHIHAPMQASTISQNAEAWVSRNETSFVISEFPSWFIRSFKESSVSYKGNLTFMNIYCVPHKAGEDWLALGRRRRQSVSVGRFLSSGAGRGYCDANTAPIMSITSSNSRWRLIITYSPVHSIATKTQWQR